MAQIKAKYLFDKDPWLLGEKIPDSDVFFFQIPFSAFVSDTSYKFIKNCKKVLATYKKFEMDFYFGKRDSFEVAESILKALIERPNFGRDLNKQIVSWSYKLIIFAKRVSKLPLENYSNRRLWQLYDEHDRVHTKLYTYGWLPVSVDMFHNNFTNKLKSYLYSVCDSKEEAEKVFVVLTTPSKKTIVAEEREDFLEIYDKYKRLLRSHKSVGTRNDKLGLALQNHAAKWGHLGYIYAGNVEPFNVSHYLKEMLELAQTGVDGKKILQKEKARLAAAKRNQTKLYKKLKISRLYRRLFEVAKDFALTKLIRRHAQLLDLYLLHQSLVSEIATRLQLTRFEVQFMLKDEVKVALLNGKMDKKALSERLQNCVFYTEKNYEQIYTGTAEKKIRATIKNRIDKNLRELVGQTAQPGYAKGRVKIIFRAHDISKMNKGDILVSIATDPDVVPVMKLAGAIVTDQGGITSHAAIVSRELGIPCIIGTKIATSVFKDGDRVEVDANKGVVRKI